LVEFAVLGAVAVALKVAIAWGLNLPNAVWMPAGAIIALKPSYDAYAGAQRVAGAIVGAILAAILLSTVHEKTVVEVAIALFLAVGIALHNANYALYSAGIATAVLMALGLADLGNLSANWERVAWTFVGIAIALAVMLLAASLSRNRAQPQVAAG
jgi:uncharacterized membrane protein YccC